MTKSAILPFIDVEASGFGPGSYPIEIGCALADGQTFCCLIRPEPSWHHWDRNAESIHGLSRDILLHHGQAAREVARQLNDRIGGLTIYTDSWYHDYLWISRLYEVAELVPRFTVEDILRLLNQEEADRWMDVKRAALTELALTRHRATNDARILQLTWMRLKRPVMEANSCEPVVEG